MNQDFLGKGLAFPLSADWRSGGLKASEGKEHIEQSIQQILWTRPGERLNRPEFGSRLHELVFEPNDDVLKALIRHYVLEAIERWEKRVVLESVEFEDGIESGHRFLVRLRYIFAKKQIKGSLSFPVIRGQLQKYKRKQ